MTNKFCVLPKILILVLSRGYHNKFNCRIKFNETLDMNNYYDPINNEGYINTEYKLIGATFAYDWNYEGTGHTVAFCKTYENNINEKIKPELQKFILPKDLFDSSKNKHRERSNEKNGCGPRLQQARYLQRTAGRREMIPAEYQLIRDDGLRSPY